MYWHVRLITHFSAVGTACCPPPPSTSTFFWICSDGIGRTTNGITRTCHHTACSIPHFVSADCAAGRCSAILNRAGSVADTFHGIRHSPSDCAFSLMRLTAFDRHRGLQTEHKEQDACHLLDQVFKLNSNCLTASRWLVPPRLE